MKIRPARLEDGPKIIELYHEVYKGTYPDKSMTDYVSFRKTISETQVFWFVAEIDEQIIGSLVLRYDQDHLLAKAYGGAVLETHQGKKILTHVMQEALNWLRENTAGVEVVYATTRSVHQAAQSLVEHFGFKKLGIFPNTHKAAGDYETHSLAAWFCPKGFQKRFTDYKFHKQLTPWLELVRSEIPDMNLPNEYIDPEPSSKELTSPPTLEIVQAQEFVKYRFNDLDQNHKLEFQFFPFHKPNLLILSADQSIEIFCNLSNDGHCVLIGGKVAANVSYDELITKASHLLRDCGARYIEMIVRADKPKIVDSIMRAKMIPSAFFPALQLKDGKRMDFIVFSRSFEIFDFQKVELKGLNQRYLEEYFKAWKQIHLNPKMLDV